MLWLDVGDQQLRGVLSMCTQCTSSSVHYVLSITNSLRAMNPIFCVFLPKLWLLQLSRKMRDAVALRNMKTSIEFEAFEGPLVLFKTTKCYLTKNFLRVCVESARGNFFLVFVLASVLSLLKTLRSYVPLVLRPFWGEVFLSFLPVSDKRRTITKERRNRSVQFCTMHVSLVCELRALVCSLEKVAPRRPFTWK